MDSQPVHEGEAGIVNALVVLLADGRSRMDPGARYWRLVFEGEQRTQRAEARAEQQRAELDARTAAHKAAMDERLEDRSRAHRQQQYLARKRAERAARNSNPTPGGPDAP